MLRDLLRRDLQDAIGFEVVGIATDDPRLPHCNAQRRGVWKYGFDDQFEPELVPRLCTQHHLVPFTGSIKSDQFKELFLESWCPDLGIMNVFGQFLPFEIFSFPRFGFFNFHATSGEQWPAYQGPDPFSDMMRDGHRRCTLAFHRVVQEVDGGELYSFTDCAEIPQGASVPDLHMITAPLASGLLRRILPKLLFPDPDIPG